MTSIGISGSTGFIGKNILEKNINLFQFVCYKKNQKFEIKEDIIIHLAGKAHDLKNIADPFEYYLVNTELTKKIFDAFLLSDAKVFITLSSVKAVADTLDSILTEDFLPNPTTHYGKSKLLAEHYILSRKIPEGKRVYILRPCMIHGPGNKGNLNLLYKIVKSGFPWPLGSFENQRSFCSIDNLCFIINELIENFEIPSGLYNIADNESLSTNELIEIIALSRGRNPFILKTPKFLINFIVKVGDYFKLPLNTERLKKLTENYIVSNDKIITAINKPLPLTAKEGLLKTLNSFNSNDK
jgi:nucleoside-diphosphate-sugar epimerase